MAFINVTLDVGATINAYNINLYGVILRDSRLLSYTLATFILSTKSSKYVLI